MSLIEQAREYIAAGISVIPIDHRTKRPLWSWKEFQDRRPEERELKSWFSGERVKAMAAVCGEVSGRLLVLDFDMPGFYEAWRSAAGELADDLPVQRTGGGGYQVFLRCEDPGRNVQLAWAANEREISGREVAIETRAEGGYVLLPPSLHPSGGKYEWIQAGAIPVIGQARAEALMMAARKLDQAPYTRQEMEAQERQAREAKPQPRGGLNGQGSVIEAFNKAHTIEEMLERYGYTRRGNRYVRPGGKNPLTVIIDGKSFHHSSDDPLKTGHLNDPFDVYVAYEHAGSISDAVKEAAAALGLTRSGARKKRSGEDAKNRPEEGAPEKAAPPPEAGEGDGGPEVTAGCTGEKAYHFTDLGNARRLLALFGDDVRYSQVPYKEWLWWNGRHWQFDTTNRIYEYVDRMVSEIYHEAADTPKGAFRDSLISLGRRLEGMKYQNSLVAKMKTMQGIAIGADDLDANPWLFPVRNGTIELESGDPVFREHRRNDYHTRAAPVEYDAAAACPKWEAFLDEIFAHDAEVIQFVQRAIGYSLTGDVSEQCLFFAYGTGANGKSVFFNTVEKLFGDFFYRAPAEMLLQQKNTQIPADVAAMKGKRMVITSELEENRRLAEAKVKSLTGSETIEARELYGKWFTFMPSHKLWMFGNHKPIITGSDEGIWRRVKVIPFTVTIPEENRRPMREMLAEFECELPGILNWALEGYRRYREAGFVMPEAMREAGNEYRSEMDILGQFVLECCEVNKNLDENGKRVWQAYHGWCEERGERAYSGMRFYQKLRERGFEVRPGHANKTIVYGLGLMAGVTG